MKKLTTIVAVISSILSVCFLFGCDKCDGPQKTVDPPLTEKEKTIGLGQIGDSIFFRDLAGKRYYAVCTNKALDKGWYGQSGHIRPCEDWSVEWQKYSETYFSNLLEDNSAHLEYSAILSGGLDGGEFPNYPKTDNCSRKTGKYFYLNINDVTFYGFTDHETMPRIHNFNFRSSLKLDGKLFQNVNYNSVNPNLETNCPSPVKGNSTIDSVYFSAQYGLIRLTTIGGKKYQRVL